MANYLDLESAIMDAEGAVAVQSVLEDALLSSADAGWVALGLKPREDLCVTALSPSEQRALQYASLRVWVAVKEVSQVFRAVLEEGRL